MTRYAYCRVSTVSQEDNTSLENQRDVILKQYPDAVIITEVFSGAKKREKFESLIEQMQPGDLLCCSRLDRFCRTTKEGLQYVDYLLEKECSVHLLDVGLIDNSAMGRTLLTVMLAFAEFERRRTIQRCAEGKEAAKKNPDFRDGRPLKYSRDRIKTAMQMLETDSLRQVESKTGISVSTLKRYKRRLNAGEKLW